MARKNQVYSQETPRSTGLSDSRITASTTPSATPKIIDRTVTRMVPFQNPSITGDWFMASKTKGQSNAGLLTSRLRNIAASTAMHARWPPSARDGGPAWPGSAPGGHR